MNFLVVFIVLISIDESRILPFFIDDCANIKAIDDEHYHLSDAIGHSDARAILSFLFPTSVCYLCSKNE